MSATTQAEMAIFPTGIDTLDGLMPGQKSGGIMRLRHAGFFGVIFGAAGSGKSVLSLQLCCRFAAGEAGRHAIYITQESAEVVRHKIEVAFRFTESSGVSNPVTIFDGLRDPRTKEPILKSWRWESLKKNPAPSTVCIVQLPLTSAEQTAKLVNLFQLINGHFCWSDDEKSTGKEDPKEHLLLCVDNAETITDHAFRELTQTGLPDASEVHDVNFYKKLRAWCAHHRLNTWFAFEEEKAQRSDFEETQIATLAQSYAADIVLRLGVTVFPSGYRERSLEIVKAKNQFYRRGRHHYSIRGYHAEDPKAATGIIVYQSLPTQLHVLGGKDLHPLWGKQPSTVSGHSHFLGIDEVDKAVCKVNTSLDAGYLASGTISLLVSDLDSLASEIALHFAFQNEPETVDAVLYITALHDADETKKMAAKYSKLKPRAMDGCFLHLAPEHISESKLLLDIQEAIECHGTNRVVFDNIFALESKFPLIRDEKHFLTALFQLFRALKVTALVVDTVEVGEGRNPLEKSFAAGLVDHVFVLRHVEFQSQTRKVFSVLTLAGLHEPQELWEIESHADRISGRDRFEFYKGVLSGHPEPVQIMLSLYADSPGSPLHHYLKIQRGVLRQVFGQNIEIHSCHPQDYPAFQQSVAKGDLRALGDCHVISIDEVWLEELLANERLERLDAEWFRTDPASHKVTDEWAHGNYVTAGLDLARSRAGQESLPPHPKQFRICSEAMPDRNNCGVLVYNSACLSACGERDSEWPPTKLTQIFDEVRREMPPRGDCRAPWGWSDLVSLQSRFVSAISQDKSGRADWPVWHDYRELERDPSLDRQITGARHRGDVRRIFPGAFTFSMENRESCVSFLLELVLSALDSNGARKFLTDEGRLVWGTEKKPARCWVAALVRMLELLDPWDIHRLADAWFRPSQSERPCVFSRQWFSSWGVLGLRFPHLGLFELPRGVADLPTPVSGAWYLGILRGGTALKAGAALIRRLTSRTEELHKFNYGVGLPVRKDLYESPDALEGIPPLPYASQFAALAAAQAGTNACPPTVLQSMCPFYRSRILHYGKVSPLLMGLIAQVARAAIVHGDPWLTERLTPFPDHLKQRIRVLVGVAGVRYGQLVPAVSIPTGRRAPR